MASTPTPTPPPSERRGAGTQRYPLTSLDPAQGDGLATMTPHEHETRATAISIFDPTIVKGAIGSSFVKLNPRSKESDGWPLNHSRDCVETV